MKEKYTATYENTSVAVRYAHHFPVSQFATIKQYRAYTFIHRVT